MHVYFEHIWIYIQHFPTACRPLLRSDRSPSAFPSLLIFDICSEFKTDLFLIEKCQSIVLIIWYSLDAPFVLLRWSWIKLMIDEYRSYVRFFQREGSRLVIVTGWDKHNPRTLSEYALAIWERICLRTNTDTNTQHPELPGRLGMIWKGNGISSGWGGPGPRDYWTPCERSKDRY